MLINGHYLYFPRISKLEHRKANPKVYEYSGNNAERQKETNEGLGREIAFPYT